MKSIDFLPKRYHEQGVRRKSQLWRFLLLVLFGGICAATAIGQHLLRRSVNAELQAVATDYAAANETNQLFDRMQTDLEEADSNAELYAFLQHPWPRTQILSSLAKPLNEAIYLSELHVFEEPVRVNRSSQRPTAQRSGSEHESDQATTFPAQMDLNRLRSETYKTQTVISIVGQTTDIGELHKYVAELRRAKLFEAAKFVSLQSIKDAARQSISRFSLRIVVQPSFAVQATRPTGDAVAAYDNTGDR